MTLQEAMELRKAIEEIVLYAPIEVAVQNKTFYPFHNPNGVKVWNGHDADENGNIPPQTKVRGNISRSILYKCITSHVTQKDWPPESTPSLWAAIDETHAGTVDDPIPAARGMEYEYGLYYLDGEDGNIYLCERSGTAPGEKITLQYLPHELVGQYFTLYTPKTV